MVKETLFKTITIKIKTMEIGEKKSSILNTTRTNGDLEPREEGSEKCKITRRRQGIVLLN